MAHNIATILFFLYMLLDDGFTPRSVHVRFMVDKVALGQAFLQVLWFSPVHIIPPSLLIHLYIICRMVNGPVRRSVPQKHSVTSSQ